MNIVTFNYIEIQRGNDITDTDTFSFIINDERIELSKFISIIISNSVHDAYLRDRSVKSVSKYLNLLCNNTIDMISEFFKTGVLRFENDHSHNRDVFEIGKAFEIDFLTSIFCAFVKSTYKEINEENFYDIYDCSTIENDTNRMNECISFFASKMFVLQEGYKIKTIKRYGYDFFESVLRSKSLKISNEDSLVSTIMSLSEDDISFFSLLNLVRVEFCNNISIKSIKNFAVKHGLESISTEVFESALLKRSKIHGELQLSNSNYFSLKAFPNKLQLSNANCFKVETLQNKLQLSNANEFCLDTFPNDLKISNVEEIRVNDNSYDNMRKLGSLRKEQQYYNQIYEVLEKASKEEDLLTIKFAVDEKYSNVRRNNERNMILEAAYKDNLCLVKDLFNQGADIRSRNIYNKTILHLFCEIGNLEGVKFALNYIDINDATFRNRTPLYFAIDNNHADICEFLSSQPNINKNVKNKDNETPLQFAIRLQRENIIEILRRNGFA
ncbi:hypothetical protein TVAG_408110 [Trichomonas vaginalis G3]|uniref:Uncharacterized protein n=1 Tax=Trichomonas vaginalis (strain ATCC PRA-98 / G3) TaxID=412133 RepID=A2FX08_TRIV3|nr:protein ubiquitination [Trichomonas vaginalis G3]EAX90556.1 hypothetical protein TVAG_408110 [Trichomonas vaginalis G3]KAI5542909.1 protein ubiquitination [Trichomonas vaginalis G3]|eukprot:XP_001303486.1 hypothetical protein [Trichomonas vaginalis G3]